MAEKRKKPAWLQECPTLPDWAIAQTKEGYRGQRDYSRFQRRLREVCAVILARRQIISESKESAVKTPTPTAAIVKLKPDLDESEPELEVSILEGLGSRIEKAVVTSTHNIWRGATLSRWQFKVVEVLG